MGIVQLLTSKIVFKLEPVYEAIIRLKKQNKSCRELEFVTHDVIQISKIQNVLNIKMTYCPKPYKVNCKKPLWYYG